MATYTYPSRDLDRPRRLLDLLGAFWAATYEGVATVERYATARARLEEQSEQILLEATDAVSRFKVPVTHTDLWYRLTLKESELNNEDVSLNRYGSGAVYGAQPGDGTTYQYGVGHSLGLFAFPVPSDLREAPSVFNRMSQPSVSLVDGLDYTVDTELGAIRFRRNPFDNPLIPKRSVYKDGVVVDREAGLWLFRGQFDQQHIFNHFGYVLSLELESSETYRSLINATWDGIVQGGHYMAMAETFAAIADAPVVRTTTEVVEDIVTDALRLLVITDKNVYRYAKTAVPVVSVGDTVYLGDQLVDTVRIYEFNQGVVPDDLLALTLSKDYLISGFFDGLTFQNKTVPLVVDTSGVFTKVSFEIGGWPSDVEKFWDDFHERGLAEGETLAHLLDTRTNKVGEPGASNLPATINPLKFLAENVLRNNVFAVKLRPTKFGPDRLGIENARQLRRVVPPHTSFIVLIQLDADPDDIIMDGPGDEEVPGYSEEMIEYLASIPIDESIDPDTYVSEEVIMRYIDGVCL